MTKPYASFIYSPKLQIGLEHRGRRPFDLCFSVGAVLIMLSLPQSPPFCPENGMAYVHNPENYENPEIWERDNPYILTYGTGQSPREVLNCKYNYGGDEAPKNLGFPKRNKIAPNVMGG